MYTGNDKSLQVIENKAFLSKLHKTRFNFIAQNDIFKSYKIIKMNRNIDLNNLKSKNYSADSQSIKGS